MDSGIVCTIFLFAILFYFLLQDEEKGLKDDKQKRPQPTPKPKPEDLKDALVNIISVVKNKGATQYLKVNNINKGVYISNDPETFKIIKIGKDKIGIQSVKNKDFLMIDYTPIHNNDYDVMFGKTSLKNNSAMIKLIKKKNTDTYYIKFFNNHYLCIDENKNMLACKDKERRFYFNFKKIIQEPKKDI